MIDVHVTDGDGGKKAAHVHAKGHHQGMVVLTDSLHDDLITVTPLLNPTFGADMNQAIAFTGTPELIHDGGDNVGWTGTAVAGTWDFADTTNPNDGTKCVSVTQAKNGDNATFTDGTETDMGTHEALTGQIRLDTYSGANNTITIQFENNTVLVGNSVNLDDYIDTGSIGGYQGFVIPKGDMGLESQIVDELNMTVGVVGTRPTFRFDQFQIEDDGAPATFTYAPTITQDVEVTGLKLIIADNVTATSSYNAIFGVSALANGIVVSIRSFGQTSFAGTFKNLIDFLSIPLTTFQESIGAADSWMTLNLLFATPLHLHGPTEDSVRFTIADDLSALAFMRVFISYKEHKGELAR